MKTLFTSVYCDGTGYAHAAIETALALEAGGIDVVCRPISLSPRQGKEAARRIAHLETKDLQGVDAVIQFSLPHTFERVGSVKNIGMFCWETTHFRKSNWADHCNLMDEIWVPCLQARQAVLDSGVKVPVKVIPIACGLTRYATRPEPLDIPSLKGKMVFYAIGENTRRKNFSGLLRAYYGAFTSRDHVALFIKTNVPGQTPEQAEAHLEGFIKELRKNLHIHPNDRSYPPIIVVTKRLSDQMLDRVHATGDVFVLPSHGESWCMPAMDAMGFGNAVVVSNWGAFPELTYAQAKDYFEPDTQTFKWAGQIHCGSLIQGSLTPCVAPDGGLPNGYTGCESWFEPDLNDLIGHMQYMYGEWSRAAACFDGFGQNGQRRVADFSHENVGKVMLKALGV